MGGFADSAVVRHLQVNVPESLLACIPENKRDALIACLAEDPRPSYQDDPTRIYHMRFADRDVHFTVSDSTATVVRIDV